MIFALLIFRLSSPTLDQILCWFISRLVETAAMLAKGTAFAFSHSPIPHPPGKSVKHSGLKAFHWADNPDFLRFHGT